VRQSVPKGDGQLSPVNKSAIHIIDRKSNRKSAFFISPVRFERRLLGVNTFNRSMNTWNYHSEASSGKTNVLQLHSLSSDLLRISERKYHFNRLFHLPAPSRPFAHTISDTADLTGECPESSAENQTGSAIFAGTCPQGRNQTRSVANCCGIEWLTGSQLFHFVRTTSKSRALLDKVSINVNSASCLASFQCRLHFSDRNGCLQHRLG